MTKWQTEYKRSSMSWEEYLGILTHPTQRDHEKRANEPKFHKKMRVRTPDHTEIPVIECGCDIQHPTIADKTFKKGEEILADSHTRREWWQHYATDLNPQPEFLSKKSIIAHSWEDIIEIFIWFNNKDDAKKANDRIYGAARAVLLPRGLSITAPHLLMVQPWEYTAAAINPSIWTRGDQSTQAEACKIVEEVYPAALWFQDEVVPVLGANIKISSPIIACVLSSWFKYRNDAPSSLQRLKEWVRIVSIDGINKSETPYDCATLFLEHWKNRDTKNRTQYTGKGHLNRGDESIRMQGFILLMIDKYVANVRQKVVPNTWSTYYKTWQKEYAMMNSNPVLSQALANN